MSYCKNCGNKLQEDAKFCDSCGTPVEEVQSEYDVYSSFQTDEQSQNGNAIINGVFGKAIASAIICSIPVGSIIAIVLSSKCSRALKEAEKVAATEGKKLTGKRVAVKVLSIISKIAGIFFTVLWPIYLLAFIMILLGEVASGVVY